MPTGALKRLFVESSSSGSCNGGGREAEPAAAVLCAPRPRRVQVHPCSADLILGPPPFVLNSNNSNNIKQKEGKSKAREEQADEEEDGDWALFGGSPPARADNPLVNDPHFLLNQRHHAVAVPDSLSDLAIFYHHSRNYSDRPMYSSSSFAPSFAPAARIQGFDVAACRSSRSGGGGGGGRVLSARA